MDRSPPIRACVEVCYNSRMQYDLKRTSTFRSRIERKIIRSSAALVLLISLAAGISCKNSTTPEQTQANILVGNECGTTVDVFFNGELQFTLEDQAGSTIFNVSLGTHDLVAKWEGTDKVVAAENPEVTQLSDYKWTVLSSANLTITNEYGETLNIYGDDSLLGQLENGKTDTLERIPYGEHKMEAKKSDDTVVASSTFVIEDNTEYTWTIK